MALATITEIYDKTIAKKVLDNPNYVPKFIAPSALGSCKRKTILMFDPKVERIQYSAEKICNEQRMFRVAKRIEQDYANIYIKKGIMFSYNSWLTEWFPNGCAGQLDFLLRRGGKWQLIEFKTSHPNQMNFTDALPKAAHIMQAEAYVYGLAEMGIKCDEYCVYYVSRGGQTTPVECWRKADIPAISKRTKDAFFELLKLRKHYRETGEAPKALEREFMLSKAPKKLDFKSKSEKPKKKPKVKTLYDVKLKPSWECNEEYCPFSGVSCEPETGTNKVASVKEGGIIEVRKGYEDLSQDIEQYVKSQIEVEEL